MIPRKTVICIGLSQLIFWGVSYYLIGGFGEAIARDRHWSHDVVYGGFAVALVVMGVFSPIIGRLIDHYGGRRVMIAGAILTAIGCGGLSNSHDLFSYYGCWIVLGIAMRSTLYDAAFATLVRIGGPHARGPMSQITFLGGLSSTVFWPIGDALSKIIGWQGALDVYAALALIAIPLLFSISNDRHSDHTSESLDTDKSSSRAKPRQVVLVSVLYVLIATMTNFLNAGMSAQMIAILTGLGLTASTAVWVATLRGIGQSSARLGEIAFGQRLNPLTLNLLSAVILPASFLFGIFGGRYAVAAIAFAFLYGIANGLVTITRGTMPLVLFDHDTYGTFVGKLITPSFLLSAFAPVVYAMVMDRFGYEATQYFSFIIAIISALASFWLWHHSGPRSPQRSAR